MREISYKGGKQMKLSEESYCTIEREEGLILLEVWEATGMEGMNLYGGFDPFIRVGNALKQFKEKTNERIL